MAIKRCAASINVVQAAEIRIKNVFRNGLSGIYVLQRWEGQLMHG